MPRLFWLGALLAGAGILSVPMGAPVALAQVDPEIEVITEPPPQGEPPPEAEPPPAEPPPTEPSPAEPPPAEPPPAEPPPAEPPPIPDTPKERLGYLRVGGGIGLGFASDLITVGVAPQVSYIFKSIVEPGISIRYQFTRDRAPIESVTWHTYGSSLFVRIFPIKQLFFLVEGEVINTGRKQAGIRFPRQTYGNLLLGGGFVIGVAKGVFVATSLKVPVLRNPFYPTAFPIISVGGGYAF